MKLKNKQRHSNSLCRWVLLSRAPHNPQPGPHPNFAPWDKLFFLFPFSIVMVGLWLGQNGGPSTSSRSDPEQSCIWGEMSGTAFDTQHSHSQESPTKTPSGDDRLAQGRRRQLGQVLLVWRWWTRSPCCLQPGCFCTDPLSLGPVDWLHQTRAPVTAAPACTEKRLSSHEFQATAPSALQYRYTRDSLKRSCRREKEMFLMDRSLCWTISCAPTLCTHLAFFDKKSLLRLSWQSWNKTITIATETFAFLPPWNLIPPIVWSCSSSWKAQVNPVLQIIVVNSQQWETVGNLLSSPLFSFAVIRQQQHQFSSMACNPLTLFLSLCFLQGTLTEEITEELNTANWSASSKYHWGLLEACNDCGKPRYHLAHAKRTWVGDGPTDCYGDKFRFVCDCEKDVKYKPGKYHDLWGADEKREVSCQQQGSWSNSPAHHNPCNRKYCVEPEKMRKARYKIKKWVPAHPDLQTPDLEGKYCPGSTAKYICDECHSGGGMTECLEDMTWRHVEPCIKIQGCKSSKTWSFIPISKWHCS